MTERLTIYEPERDPDEFDSLEIFRGEETVADMAPDGVVTDEHRRMARLFAASEDMLAALKLVENTMLDGPISIKVADRLLEDIDEVIAKAEGRE